MLIVVMDLADYVVSVVICGIGSMGGSPNRFLLEALFHVSSTPSKAPVLVCSDVYSRNVTVVVGRRRQSLLMRCITNACFFRLDLELSKNFLRTF